MTTIHSEIRSYLRTLATFECIMEGYESNFRAILLKTTLGLAKSRTRHVEMES
jgi:hypothetical protein